MMFAIGFLTGVAASVLFSVIQVFMHFRQINRREWDE